MSASDIHSLILIGVMAIVTALLRFLPFLIFGGKKTPEFIEYLGKVLPYSVMGMLTVYCLKDMHFENYSGYVPSIVGVIATIVVHVWKRNTIYSILTGTIVYMVLVRL